MPRREPTQARSQATMSRILDAAHNVIEDRGVFGLTTGLVAETAGVSIGTVYRYFGDATDIIDALAPGLEDWVQDQYHVKWREKQHGLVAED